MFPLEGRRERAMGLSSKERRRRVFVMMAAKLCRLGGGEHSDARVRVWGQEKEMKVADVLVEGDQGDWPRMNIRDGGGSGRMRDWKGRCSGRVSPPPPRCQLLSRWLPSKQFTRCRGGEEEEDRAETARGSDGGTHEPPSAEETANMPDSAAAPSPGRNTETCLNMGMGAGLVLLLTRSVTEFKKMTELRAEMEALLKEIKDAVQGKDDARSVAVHPGGLYLACCSSNSGGNLDWSHGGCQSVRECSQDPCLELAEVSCSTELADERSIGNGACQEDKSVVVDQMEEELQFELELLQLNSENREGVEDADHVRQLPHREELDVSGCFTAGNEISGGREQREMPAEPGERGGEDEEDGCGDDGYGVCPRELTSRLHELLEAQQQDRIAELESALALAKIKLREKDMEICWWRDTARLVSQHREDPRFR